MGYPVEDGMVERVARVLHGKLFATITDWRDELVPWDDLNEMDKAAFMHTARAALAKARGETTAQEDTDNRDGVL